MSQFSFSESSTTGLSSTPWAESGIAHGFCGTNLCPTLDDFDKACEQLISEYKLQSLFIPKQEHTDEVVLVDAEGTAASKGLTRSSGPADAMILAKDGGSSAVAVMSADCVPVLFHGDTYVAAVHAGWRGLASNIIEKVAYRLNELGENNLTAAIGPCASGELYEVGFEVIEAIGDSAVYQTKDESKALLDLEKTAKTQLLLACPGITYTSADICTIADQRFSSYRRSGTKRGVNLSFICTLPHL